jgi:hypothetical protein
MAVLKISNEQILALVLQLSEQQRAWLFAQLAARQWPSWAELSQYGEQQAHEWRSVDETLYLLSVPDMRESIREGMDTPPDECSDEAGW